MYRTTIYSILLLLCTAIAGQAATGPAQIVSLRPSVRLYVNDVLAPAVVGRAVLSGNRLETDAHGRLSLLLPDHGLLKIAGDTRFVYQEEDDGPIRLNRGKLWMRALYKAAAFLHRPVIGLQTPTAVVGVRGTEWYTEVAPDGTTTVGIVDGSVDVSNRLGPEQPDAWLGLGIARFNRMLPCGNCTRPGKGTPTGRCSDPATFSIRTRGS